MTKLEQTDTAAERIHKAMTGMYRLESAVQDNDEISQETKKEIVQLKQALELAFYSISKIRLDLSSN